MDFFNFISLLKKDYREVLYSLILSFPLSYLDCWYMYPVFKEWDIFPQIIISIGIATIASGFGIILSLSYFCIMEWKAKINTSDNINAIWIIFPLLFTSAFTLLNDIHSKSSFALIFLSSFVCAILFFLILAAKINNHSKRRKNNDNRNKGK